MTENINPNEPRKLTDDELDSVTGGTSWESRMETDLEHTFGLYKGSAQFKDATFEEFVQWFYRKHPDYLKCRDAWIADGRPTNVFYHLEADGAITKEAITWAN